MPIGTIGVNKSMIRVQSDFEAQVESVIYLQMPKSKRWLDFGQCC